MKIEIKNTKGEVIFSHECEENTVKKTVVIELAGTIGSPFEFLSKRYDQTNQINQKRCHVIVNRSEMKTAEEKAKAYAKKRIVLENRNKFSDEANLRAAEYFAYKAYSAGYSEAMRWRDPKKELPKNKFNPDDYECLAGVCPDLSDDNHCETCILKRLKEL